MNIPFCDLGAQYQRIKPEIIKRIEQVLDHGRYIMGPEIGELEIALSEFCGAKHTVGVSSGTDALLAALMVQEIGPGDAVYVPAFTFTATAEVVTILGASPVFVDVEQTTFNIDAADLRQKIADVEREGRLRSRAIIAVDLFGLPADYAQLGEIADKHGLGLIGDAAQSFGAGYRDKRVGTLAPITTTSFFPAKPLGCYGDGGAVFTEHDEYAEMMRSIRQHGQGAAKYENVRVGINGRLDTIQAAVLLEKLAIFQEELGARERLARHYDARLKDRLVVPPRIAGSQSAWAQYSVVTENRDTVAASLKERGIPTAIYYPLPMHMQPAYQAFGNGGGSLPVSEALSKSILSLPMHPYMEEATADRVCDAIEDALAEI